MTGLERVAYDVVVLYYRAGEQTLGRTMEAVLQQSEPPRGVIVVDNASSDGVVAALDADDRVATLVLPHNLGYAGGMNRGAATLPDGATYTLFLTHETELLPNAASALISAAAKQSALIAGPQLLRRADSTVWSAGGRILPLGGVAHLTAAPDVVPYEVDWLDGAALLMSTSEMASAGGFEERFFLYWEDVEIALRLRDSGPVICVPSAVAVQETGLAPPYFDARNRILLWRLRRRPDLTAISVLAELRRCFLEIARRPRRMRDARGRAWGVFDGLTGGLHPEAARLRSASAEDALERNTE